MKYLLCSLLVALVVGPTYADDWPQWLGTQREGVWREAGIVDQLPKEPKKLWTAPVGIGYAGPAVAAGFVFVTDRELAKDTQNPNNPFDRQSKVAGTERLQCFDAKTGQQRWKYDYPCSYQISYSAGPRCTPTVDGDRVYFLGAMGDYTCLDTATGAVKWKKNLVKDFDANVPVWGFACHPLVEGDTMITLGGGDGKLVVALDKRTGEPRWTSQSCEGDFGYCPPVIYTFGGVRQLIVWHARAVVGLNPTTGQRLWSVPFAAKAALTAPMPRQVGTDRLLITSFYNGSMLLQVGADAATEVWRSTAKGEMPAQTQDLSAIMCTPVIDGDYTYGVCSHGELRCLLTATGERKWMTMKATRGSRTPEKILSRGDEPDPQTERWGHAFIVKHENKHILFNEQGDLIFAKLAPQGYTETSRAHLIEPTNTMARGRKVVWMHPAFADKCVFVRNDTELICYSLAK
jgi:outer membrane protein assembly factor BamB